MAIVVAICSAALAGWYAINGLLVLFPGAGWSTLATGIAVEAGKVFVAGYACLDLERRHVAHADRAVGGRRHVVGVEKCRVYSALIRAHEAGHTEASIAVNRDAVPLAQQLAVEEGAMRDLEIRIAQGDDIVRAATAKGHARTASDLAAKLDKTRAQLVMRRQAIAERIAKPKEEQAGIEARKARAAAELGPALAIARLFGSGDVDGAIRVVCLCSSRR